MIREPSLYVLAEAAEIGLPEAASVPARAFDPLLRGSISRRVTRAVEAATARTTSKRGDHVLRLAFLDSLGTAPSTLDPNDERAVEQAFRTLAAPYLPAPEDPAHAPPKGGAYRAAAADREPGTIIEVAKRAKRRWPITTPAIFLTIAGILASVAVTVVPRLLPTPSARFRKTAFGKALGEPLTDVVVAANRGGNADARAKLLSPEVKKQIGADAYASLEHAVDELPHARGDGDASLDTTLAPLHLEVNALDAKLAAAKVPAHVHVYGSGSANGAVVWLTSYFVEQRDELGFDGKPLRFVWGRRMDGLNLTDLRLYKADAEDWAIVSMDLVEQEFVQRLLAPLAQGKPMSPDDSVSEQSMRAELGRVAGRVIAAELVAKTKVSAADASALYSAIGQRNQIADSLSRLGYRFPITSGIELSAGTATRIARARDENPRDRILLDNFAHMNERAAGYRGDVAPAVSALARLEEEELGGAIVERKRLAEVATPELGDAASTSPRARALVASALAMVARPQTCPKLALWRLTSPAFDGRGAEAAMSTVVSTALLVRLGLGPPGNAGSFDDSDDYERSLAKALELETAQIEKAALATYQELFGRTPPTFTRKQL